MGHLVFIALISVLAIPYSHGTNCEMNPPGTPWIPQTVTLKDTFRGELLNIDTRNIEGIANVGPAQNLMSGPYFAASLEGSVFKFSTHANFANYEEVETEERTSLTVSFNCAGGTTRSLTIIISITDTNNNDPLFRTNEKNELEFTVIPPLSPGFSITGCLDDIIVRDIDLTTERIKYEIFESPLFEISYDAASSTEPKEFKASLRTTQFIRSIPEPIVFRISATDVDRTSDPPRTTFATVRIKSDGEFELPDEPVFSQAFYLATYTKDHRIYLDEPISLRQGYNEQVQFTLDQGTTNHFNIRREGNEISLIVVTPLTEDFLAQRQLLLVIKAESENTSGAKATIIVELPEEEELQFEQPAYVGAIVDNVLQLSQLVLSQGYANNPVSVEILSDYAKFFGYKLERNIITLSMVQLPDNILEENTFLNLRVVASTNRTSVSTMVTLEIVKDDSVTPVFGSAVYEGLYDTADGLSLERIVLVQGYDETVRVSLQGEHADDFFKINQDGAAINLDLTVPSLPSELFREQNLILYLRATKPRTVGATTAISIALPAEIQLEFEQSNYEGVIEDNVLRLPELILSKGYQNEIVSVTIISNYAAFFRAEIEQNKITLSMLPLDAVTIEQNTFLNLEIVAATNRSSASTIVTLEIIKDDSVTPVFEQAVYSGSYDPIEGLTLQEIVITQGYDETVRVFLEGEHSGYFQIDRLGPRINLKVSSLPSVLFREQSLIFSIVATKPRTVGASAAISIALPPEIQLEFEQPNYKGSIKDNTLQLAELILSQGYDDVDDPVSVNINNEHASYFNAEIERNIITISMSRLDNNIIEENTFINLQVVASTNRSSAMTIVTLEIIKDDIVTPVFERNVYEGSYDPVDGLKLETIVLTQGYDDTVTVRLLGEHNSYFKLTEQGPRITVSASSLPANLLSMPNLLLTIEATKPRTVGANAAISIAFPEARDMRFAAEFYTGTIRENFLQVEDIVLSVGYTEDVSFSLTGEHASFFNVTNVQNQISVDLLEPIPDSIIEENNFLLLTLSASAVNAVTATTTIAIDVIKEDLTTPVFSQNIYYGNYARPSSIEIGTISLSQGNSGNVSFRLDGEHSQYFRTSVSENGAVLLELHSAIPEEVIFNEKVLLFSILAEKELTVGANAAISINFPRELTEPSILRFAKNIYIGRLQQNVLTLEDVVLETGYAAGTQFALAGEFSQHFTWTSTNNILRISAANSLPTEIFNRKFISLEVEARRTRAVSVPTTIIIDIEQPEVVVPPVFAEAYYRGVYTQENELEFKDGITLSQGFDDTVRFELDGESSQWFDILQDNDTLYITTKKSISVEVVEANHHLLFSIVAQKPYAIDGRAAISIDLLKEVTGDQVLGFDRLSYVGSVANNAVDLGPIVLSGLPASEVSLSLQGPLANYFRPALQGTTVTVTLPNPIPLESIPENRIIVLEIQASAPQSAPAYAAIVLHVISDDDTSPVVTDLVFGETYYVGSYAASTQLLSSPTITLAEGYGSDVQFTLEGDDSQWFTTRRVSNGVTLELSSVIPAAVVANKLKLIFTISAHRVGSRTAQSAIVISFERDVQDSLVAFDEVLYKGIIQGSTVHHGAITVVGNNGNSVRIAGEYASLFRATLSDNSVEVQSVGPLTLPSETRHVVLELWVADAGAVLILQVTATEEQPPPTVSFERSYVFNVENRYTGPVGQVRATADSGEDIASYSLYVDDEHLRSRLSVSNDGELRLSAPADTGVYTFQVIATTVFTKATGQTTVQLRVQEAIDGPIICGDDIVTAPLIVIDRDEEEAHRDLWPLNAEELPGCQYKLTNRWPVDQKWLYVDESGLHTIAIDREDPSIAYMTVSQVQVELTVVCDSDTKREKRSLDKRQDWLERYNYGDKKWVLTDSIAFNPRRSIVNLIVNDINDNPPIFVGKENEPIIVGYPISDLEESIMPRSLAELQATDADVGINAELLYWSEDPEIAVSPTTGFVHVRSDVQLQDNMLLTVNATDQNGAGLTGSISLMVRLLDSQNIAVITVRDAFLEDERHILGNISNAIGYEVRALRSMVVPTAAEEQATRKKRDTTATAGTALEVYVYGLFQREPVAVERLSDDINSAAIVTVDIASILSLEDHLEGNEICVIPGRDTGLLVATIVLSILLFILIVAAVVWYFLTRKKQENYDQFSDANSLASQNESQGQIVKPEFVAKPRLNIEELKRSERRLQDMLNAPIEGVTVEPTPSTSTIDTIKPETKPSLPDPLPPIVIQDKLKDASDDSDEEDEFGERKKTRRKSVVTFNENVEKIIPVDDEPNVIADSNYEVYKL